MAFTYFLIALWSIVPTFDLFGPQFTLWRPIITASITGLILGDFTQGLMIGATLELMWLGVTGIGAFVPPDIITGSIIGTAFGIISGKGAVAGIAIAVPIAVAAQQLDIIARTITIRFSHRAEKAAEVGDLPAIERQHWYCIILFMLSRAVPIFLALYFGAGFVEKLFNSIPKFIMDGLSVAGGMLPAVGFAMLLVMMFDKKLWPFCLVGFLLSVYLHIPTLGLALFGLAFAFFYEKMNSPKTVQLAQTDGEELDL